MNKKDYKGYELIKAISDKEIKDKTKIEVHSLKVLDNTIAVIGYSNKRLEWETGEFDTSYLFDKDYYFRILEDNTEEIEEFKIDENGFIKTNNGTWKGRKLDVAFANKINQLIREINKLKENK